MVEKRQKSKKPSGEQDRVTICGILDHQPLHTEQHLSCYCSTWVPVAVRGRDRKPASQILLTTFCSICHFLLWLSFHTHSRSTHPPTLSSINFCYEAWRWWKLHTQSGEDVCVSPCAKPAPLLMSLLRIRMTPAVLCVLDTKNRHSALTLQSCPSTHIQVLSLKMEAI